MGEQILQEIITLITRDWASDYSLARGLLLPFSVAFAGALFGASTAYLFARRGKQHDDKLLDLDATYRAAQVAASICNSALGAKKQQVAPMARKFRSERQRIASIYGTPTVRKIIEVDFDLEKISPYDFGASELPTAVGAIRIKGAQDMLQSVAISHAAQQWKALIEARNEWINDFRSSSGKMPTEERVNLYFGFQLAGNVLDQTHKSSVEGISDLLDDIIYLSYEYYHRSMRSSFAKRRGISASFRRNYKLQYVDFSSSWSSGLMPSAIEYKGWNEPAKKLVPRKWYQTNRMYEDEMLRAIEAEMMKHLGANKPLESI